MPRALDLTGQRFGRLTVVARAPNHQSTKPVTRWLCKCACGRETTVLTCSLRAPSGRNTVSCGCKANGPELGDLTGLKWGRLTALRRDTKKSSSRGWFWFFRCDCGTIKSLSNHSVKRGSTTSCGCYYAESRTFTRVSRQHIERRKQRNRMDRTVRVRAWRQSNPVEWRKQRASIKRGTMERLSGNYVRGLLKQTTGLPARLIPDSLVDAKRSHLRITRLLKETE